jgi:hypothetical protein
MCRVEDPWQMKTHVVELMAYCLHTGHGTRALNIVKSRQRESGQGIYSEGPPHISHVDSCKQPVIL